MGRPPGRPPLPRVPTQRDWVRHRSATKVRATYEARARTLWQKGQPFFRVVKYLITRLTYRLAWDQGISHDRKDPLWREHYANVNTWAFQLGQIILGVWWSPPGGTPEARSLDAGITQVVPGARFGHYSLDLDPLDLPQADLVAHARRMARDLTWLHKIAGPDFHLATVRDDRSWMPPPLLVWAMLQTTRTEFEGPHPTKHLTHLCAEHLADHPYAPPPTEPHGPATDPLLQFFHRYTTLVEEKGLIHKAAIAELADQRKPSSRSQIYVRLREARRAKQVLDTLAAAYPDARHPPPHPAD